MFKVYILHHNFAYLSNKLSREPDQHLSQPVIGLQNSNIL